MRALPLILACGISLAAFSLSATPASAEKLDTTFQKLTQIEFHHETFQTRHGHQCTLKDNTLECRDGDQRWKIADNKIEQIRDRNEKDAPAEGPQPAFLPAGAKIKHDGIECGVTNKEFICATDGGKTWLKSTESAVETNSGELYQRKDPPKETGGVSATFGGKKGHKFTLTSLDAQGDQIACFIPEHADLEKDPEFITCGTKTAAGLAGQFRIGAELYDLGTAQPLAPFADTPSPRPIEVRRGDVHCSGENAALICQTPLGEFQITTQQAGFDHIQPFQLPHAEKDQPEPEPQP